MSDATRSNVPHVETIQPNPARAKDMPYAPAVRIVGACDLMFISGVTPSPLYHMHPHIDSEHQHPIDIGEQTRLALAGAKEVLDSVGASWADVVKITKYLTDIRDADGMHAVMRTYFGDWKPASTMICINQLSSPGARLELDMIVALPKPAAK
jgi:enamine deaminase RidA (YjgF/YER057c/UK114 family)